MNCVPSLTLESQLDDVYCIQYAGLWANCKIVNPCEPAFRDSPRAEERRIYCAERSRRT